MPTANWKRLGEQLVRRRIELDPRYTNRKLFAAERGINYRIVSDIERGRRDNYEDGTIAAAEVAYRVTSGSLARTLEGEGLEPLPELRPVPEPPADASLSPAERERDRLLAEHPDDEVLRMISRGHGVKTSQAVMEMLDWLGSQGPWAPPQENNGTAGLTVPEEFLKIPSNFSV